MSAYGAISKPIYQSILLSPTLWRVKSKSNSGVAAPAQYVVMFHLTLAAATSHEGLVDFMHNEFADEIERGDTYPQEALPGERLTKEAFVSYYFAADVLLGLVTSEDDLLKLGASCSDLDEETGKEIQTDFDAVRAGRDWKDCVAGFYYVRSNLHDTAVINRRVLTFE